MKSYTEEEINAKLREFDEKEARGESVWYSLDETFEHMDETIAKLKKQRAKEQHSAKKKTGRRRVASAV